MSNCMLKANNNFSDSAAISSQVAVSSRQVDSSNSKNQPFVGSYLWRKHFAKDGPAPRNEEGMVIGRDT